MILRLTLSLMRRPLSPHNRRPEKYFLFLFDLLMKGPQGHPRLMDGSQEMVDLLELILGMGTISPTRQSLGKLTCKESKDCFRLDSEIVRYSRV